MAKLTIGGVEYSIPELNFIALERCWPYVEQAMASNDLMSGVRAGLHICASGMMEMEDFNPEAFDITEDMIFEITQGVSERSDAIFILVGKTLMRRMRASEISQVRIAMDEIMREAGLVAEPGEAPATGEKPISQTGTSAPSSRNLSRRVSKAARGKRSVKTGASPATS